MKVHLKFGAIGLTESLTKEVWRYNSRVIALARLQHTYQIDALELVLADKKKRYTHSAHVAEYIVAQLKIKSTYLY